MIVFSGGLGTSSIELCGSVTTVLVTRVDLTEIRCEGGRWMELAQDHVQWQALVLLFIYLQFMLLL